MLLVLVTSWNKDLYAPLGESISQTMLHLVRNL